MVYPPKKSSRHREPEKSSKINNSTPRRTRTTYTPSQIAALEVRFMSEGHYITAVDRRILSEKLNIPERGIKVWFQNRRMREKRDRKGLYHYLEGSDSAVPSTSSNCSGPSNANAVLPYLGCDNGHMSNAVASGRNDFYKIAFGYTDVGNHSRSNGYQATAGYNFQSSGAVPVKGNHSSQPAAGISSTGYNNASSVPYNANFFPTDNQMSGSLKHQVLHNSTPVGLSEGQRKFFPPEYEINSVKQEIGSELSYSNNTHSSSKQFNSPVNLSARSSFSNSAVPPMPWKNELFSWQQPTSSNASSYVTNQFPASPSLPWKNEHPSMLQPMNSHVSSYASNQSRAAPSLNWKNEPSEMHQPKSSHASFYTSNQPRTSCDVLFGYEQHIQRMSSTPVQTHGNSSSTFPVPGDQYNGLSNYIPNARHMEICDGPPSNISGTNELHSKQAFDCSADRYSSQQQPSDSVNRRQHLSELNAIFLNENASAGNQHITQSCIPNGNFHYNYNASEKRGSRYAPNANIWSMTSNPQGRNFNCIEAFSANRDVTTGCNQMPFGTNDQPTSLWESNFPFYPQVHNSVHLSKNVAPNQTVLNSMNRQFHMQQNTNQILTNTPPDSRGSSTEYSQMDTSTGYEPVSDYETDKLTPSLISSSMAFC